MKYKIIHETKYQFNADVFFEPHYLRFKPKNTPNIEFESFNLKVFPEPAGITESLDPENNRVHFCWFNGMHNQMEIRAELLLSSNDHNPFNFILYPNKYLKIPFTYDDNLKEILQPALILQPINQPLIKFGQQLLLASNANTLEFLSNLTKQIHADFKLIIRETGNPYAPDLTFEYKYGSCRDLAWMQVILLRHMGLAARFVSGYFYIFVDKPEFELHAWVEVFLPGAGWIGFDPSHGIIAGNQHIPISSSARFENTMPVSGTVRGNANSELFNTLKIEVM